MPRIGDDGLRLKHVSIIREPVIDDQVIQVTLIAEDYRHDRFVFDGETWVKVNPRTVPPSMTFDREAAQRLMSQLYHAGVRMPNYGTTGQVDAMRAHIEDLRTVAFHALDVRKDG